MSPEKLRALKEELRRFLAEVGAEDSRDVAEGIIAIKAAIQDAESKGNRMVAVLMKRTLVTLERIQSLSDRVQQEEEEFSRKESPTSDEPRVGYTAEPLAPQEAEAAENVEQAKLFKDRIVLEEELRYCLRMPACCERSLIRLQCFIGLIDQDILNAALSAEQSVDVREGIEEDKKFLEGHLQGTKYSAEERVLFLQIKTAIEGCEWKSALGKARALLKRIRPFNVREMRRLMAKGDEAAEQIKGQDIVLFLGESGTGKSTTIHYLAGTPLKEMEVNADGSMRLLQIMLSPEVDNIAKWKRENESANRTNVLLVYEEETRVWYICGKGGDGKPRYGEVGSAETPLRDLLNGRDVEQAKAIDARTLLKTATQFLNCSSGMSHFEPTVSALWQESALKDVTVSAVAKSETRYIKAVPVEFEDALGDKKSIILCDAPGLGDTRGAEVDVANSMGIIEAIKGCRSVRPLIFVSYPGIGDRLQGINSLAYVLASTIPNVDEYKSAFFYVFTKYPEGQESGINAKLKSRRANMSEGDQSDSAFLSLFEDMDKKTLPGALRKKSFILDLHRKDQEAFLRALMNDKVIDPIENPAQAFHFMITEKSKRVIVEQLTRDLDGIRSAIESADYELVKYRLDDLSDLYRVLHEVEQVRGAYQEGIHLIVDHINRICDDAKIQLEECLDDRYISLSMDDIRRYKSCMADVATCCRLVTEESVIQASDLALYLSIIVAELLPAQQVEHLRSQVMEKIDLVKTRSDKIKFIVDHFPELPGLSLQYSKVVDALQGQLDEWVEKAEKSVHKIVQFVKNTGKMEVADVKTRLAELFDKSAEELSAISRMKDSFSEHLTREKVGDKHERFSKALIKCLQEFRKSSVGLFEGGELKDEGLRQLNGWILMMEAVENAVALHAHVELGEIKSIHQQLLESIYKHFMSLQGKIMKYFSGKPRVEDLPKIGDVVKQMENIRQIAGAKEVTADAYHKTTHGIIAFVGRLVEDVLGILEKQAKERDPVEEEGDFVRLSRYLLGLRDASWMDEPCSEVRNDKLTDIVQRLTSHAQSLTRTVVKVDLSLEKSVNLVEVDRLMSKIVGMGELGKIVGEVEVTGIIQSLNAANERVNQSIRSVLQDLATSFSLEQASVERLREDVRKLESLKRAPRGDLFTQLKYKEHESIEKLREHIGQIETEMESLKVRWDGQKGQKIACCEALKKLKQAYEDIAGTPQRLATRARAQRDKAASQFLADNHYDSLEQLDALIKESEQSIHEIEASFAEEQSEKAAQRRGLVEIEREYNALPSGEVLLANDRYHTIDELNAAIRCKRQEVDKYDHEKHPYLFQKLDALKVVQALNYLRQLQNCPHLTRVDTEKVRIDLERFIEQYGSFIQRQMDACYKNIVAYTKPGEEMEEAAQADIRRRLHQNAKDFLVRFQEAVDLEQGYPEVASCFHMRGSGSIVHAWRQTLQQDCFVLSADMERFWGDRELVLLQSKIAVARVLSVTDKFIGDGLIENYGSLYGRYQRYLEGVPADAEKEINMYISQYQYEIVAEKMSILSQLDNHEPLYKRLRQIIANSLKQLVEGVKLEVIIVFDDKIDIKKIGDIVTPLDHVLDALAVLSRFLDASVSKGIKEDLQRVRDSISEVVGNFLRIIECSINSNNFYEAHQRVKLVKTAMECGILRSCWTDPIQKKISALEERESRMVDEVVTKYSSMDISDYGLNPPKDIYNRFRQAWEGLAAGAKYYEENWEKIAAVIVRRVNEAMEKARHERPERQNELIRWLNRTLQTTLPDSTWTALDGELQRFEDDIKQQEKGDEQKLQNACGADDPVEIKKLLDEFVDQGKRILADKLKDKALELIQQKKADIEGNFSKLTLFILENMGGLFHEDVSKVFRAVEKVVAYHNALSEVQGVERVFSDVQKELGSVLDSVTSRIESSLSRDAVIGPSEIRLAEESFAMLFVFAENYQTMQAVLGDFWTKLQQVHSIIAQYFEHSQKRFRDCLSTMDIPMLKNALDDSKKWSALVPAKMRKYVLENSRSDRAASFQKLSKVFVGYVAYEDMVQTVSDKIEGLRDEIGRLELLDDAQITWGDQQREDFYRQINDMILTLGKVCALRMHVQERVDVDKIGKEALEVFRKKVEDFCARVIEPMDNPGFLEMDRSEYGKLNVSYCSLVLLARCINSPELVANIKRTVERIKSKVLEKVEVFQKEVEEEIVDTRLQSPMRSDLVDGIAQRLIRMELIADNIHDFKGEIGRGIDKLMLACKKQRATRLIYQLTEKLAQSDTGNAVIAEHLHKHSSRFFTARDAEKCTGGEDAAEVRRTKSQGRGAIKRAYYRASIG